MGYAVSSRGGEDDRLLRKTRHRGRDRVGWQFLLTAAVYNLVRLRTVTVAVT